MCSQLRESIACRHGFWWGSVTQANPERTELAYVPSSTCHMRKDFANSTSSHWNAGVSELTSPWLSRFSDFFLRQPRPRLRGQAYRLLLGPGYPRRRRGVFSEHVVKYWSRLSCYPQFPPLRNSWAVNGVEIFLKSWFSYDFPTLSHRAVPSCWV